LIHQEYLSGISSNFVTSGGSCLFISFVIWNLIVLYSGHINPISCEASLKIRLDFILKGIELFLILSFILCFKIDIDGSNSFSR